MLGILPGAAGGFVSKSIGVLPCGIEIARAMLVVNGERKSRAPIERRQSSRASRKIQNVLPGRGGLRMSSLSSQQHGETRQRVAAHLDRSRSGG